jgi:hypothetical protein
MQNEKCKVKNAKLKITDFYASRFPDPEARFPAVLSLLNLAFSSDQACQQKRH